MRVPMRNYITLKYASTVLHFHGFSLLSNAIINESQPVKYLIFDQAI